MNAHGSRSHAAPLAELPAQLPLPQAVVSGNGVIEGLLPLRRQMRRMPCGKRAHLPDGRRTLRHGVRDEAMRLRPGADILPPGGQLPAAPGGIRLHDVVFVQERPELVLRPGVEIRVDRQFPGPFDEGCVEQSMIASR